MLARRNAGVLIGSNRRAKSARQFAQQRFARSIVAGLFKCGVEASQKFGPLIVPIEPRHCGFGHAALMTFLFRLGRGLQAIGLIELGDDDALIIDAHVDAVEIRIDRQEAVEMLRN